MNINGIGGGQSMPAGAGAGQTMDTQSRNITRQIEEARKKLQEISSNGEITPEEKMKKRQEIQKQISDLRMQLRQHQMELKREQQAEKGAAENGNRGESAQEEQAAGISAAGMQAVISADNSMKQAKVQSGVAAKLEGRTGVLEAEIKQDERGGGNTKAKEAELAETREKADAAKVSGVKTLKEAGQKMRGAAGTEQNAGAKRADLEIGGEKTEEIDEDSGEQEDKAGSEPGMYVDVRL